jgi:thiol-disulfide isomerase/thioredoxin
MALWAGSLLPLAAQVAEPPLPTNSEESSPFPVDLLVPALDQPAAGLPMVDPTPVDFPPISELPEEFASTVTAPEGNAPMPEIPEIPGLVLPKVKVKTQEEARREAEELAADPSKAARDPLATIAPSEPFKFYRSPREARQVSIKQKKPMILVFGGFEWSPACRALNNDLLSHPAFHNFAQQHLVVSVLNVPTRTGDSEQKMKELDAIKRYRTFLKVRSLPTMILFDENGRELKRVSGYKFSTATRENTLIRTMTEITEPVEEIVEKAREKQKRRKLLTELQKYRDWTSATGSTLFAKVRGPSSLPKPTETDPEAREPAVELMDEEGKILTVALRQISVADQAVLAKDYQIGSVEVSIEPVPPAAPVPAAGVPVSP